MFNRADTACRECPPQAMTRFPGGLLVHELPWVLSCGKSNFGERGREDT